MHLNVRSTHVLPEETHQQEGWGRQVIPAAAHLVRGSFFHPFVFVFYILLFLLFSPRSWLMY